MWMNEQCVNVKKFHSLSCFVRDISRQGAKYHSYQGHPIKPLSTICKFFASRMCKIFCLHCVSIDSVSHPSSFMNGYNKTRVNLRSHNRSCECKDSSIHSWWVRNNLHWVFTCRAWWETKECGACTSCLQKTCTSESRPSYKQVPAYLTWCPTNTRTNCPLWISHNRHVLSADPVAM